MDTQSHLDYSPYRDFYRVKVSRFPGGGAEAVCFKESVYQPNSAELNLKAKRSKNGGEFKVLESVEVGEDELERRRQHCVSEAVRRASHSVRFYVKRMGADHLLTVTYRENQGDYDQAKKDWKKFVRQVKARYSEWKYVVITEKQDRGAIHFHAAVVGRQNVNYLRECWYTVVGRGMGNIDVKGPPRRWGGAGYDWKESKLAGYLTKYMAKGFSEALHHAKRYWASRDVAPVKVTAFYIECRDMDEAIRHTFSIVAAGLAIDVSHWLMPSGGVYWVSSSREPSCPF